MWQKLTWSLDYRMAKIKKIYTTSSILVAIAFSSYFFYIRNNVLYTCMIMYVLFSKHFIKLAVNHMYN